MSVVRNKVIGYGLAAVIAASSSWVAVHEGYVPHAYRDAVGVPTICYGETNGVQMGDKVSKEQCDILLTLRLAEFAQGVDDLVQVPMSENRHAALTSFSFNVGLNKFSQSTLLKRINAKDKGACDELLRWVYAGGKKLNGLVKRRKQERDLCNS